MSAISSPDDLDPETRALARRIERGEPNGYWEENLALGRRGGVLALREWMEPLEARQVLLLGWAEHEQELLTERGARATRWRGSVADLAALDLPGPVDDLVLWEVLERYAEDDRGELLRAVERLAPSRLFVAHRQESTWTRFVPSIKAVSLPTADPVLVLRSIHLETQLRLLRQQTLRRRNSVLHLIELQGPQRL